MAKIKYDLLKDDYFYQPKIKKIFNIADENSPKFHENHVILLVMYIVGI